MLVVAMPFAGCGGDEATPPDAEPVPRDPEAVLEETFGGEGGVAGGFLEAGVEFTLFDGASTYSQRFALEGPFELGSGAPSFDLGLTVEQGDGPAAEARLASTGEAGFLELGGVDYEIDPAVFERLARSFEAGGDPFDALDPSRWFLDASLEGTAEHGGVETVQVSGPAIMSRLFDDLRELTGMLGLPALGPLGGKNADATLDVFSGLGDSVLRRLELTIPVEGELEGGQPFENEITLSLALGEVNDHPAIEPPAEPRSITELDYEEVPAELSGLVGFVAGDGPGAPSR